MTKKILSTTLAITTMAVITVVATTLLWTPTNAQGDTPGKPTGLTSTGHTHNTADLAWTASPDTVDGYKILRRDVKAQSPGQFSSAGKTSATSYTVTGLTPETKYAFRVVAYSGNNESARSNYVNVTTDAEPAKSDPPDSDPPNNGNSGGVTPVTPEPTQEPEHSEQQQDDVEISPVTNLQRSDRTDTGITLTWDGSSGNADADFYQIWSKPTVTDRWHPASQRVTYISGQLFSEVRRYHKDYPDSAALQPGQSYDFRIDVIDADTGEEALGNVLTSYTLLNKPANFKTTTHKEPDPNDEDEEIDVQSTTHDTVPLQWDPVRTTHLHYYRLERKKSGQTEYTQVATIWGGSKYTDTGLEGETTYEYNLMPVDRAGDEAIAEAQTSGTTKVAPPEEVIPPPGPTGLRVSDIRSHRVDLNWSEPVTDREIDDYQVKCRDADSSGSSYNDVGDSFQSGDRSSGRKVLTVKPDTHYACRIEVDYANSSDVGRSNTVSFITPVARPANLRHIPQIQAADEVNVWWDNPDPYPFAYNLHTRRVDSNEWVLVTIGGIPGTHTNQTITGVREATDYHVRLTAYSDRSGSTAPASSTIRVSTKPGTVRLVPAEGISSSSIQVEWTTEDVTDPNDDGTHYQVWAWNYRQGRSSAQIVGDHVASSPWVHTGLKPSERYDYFVRHIGENGTHTQNPGFNNKYANTLAAPVRNLRSSETGTTHNRIVLRWKRPAGMSMDKIGKYVIHVPDHPVASRQTQEITNISAVIGYIRELDPGTTYEVTVTIHDVNGSTAPARISATTKDDPAAADEDAAPVVASCPAGVSPQPGPPCNLRLHADTPWKPTYGDDHNITVRWSGSVTPGVTGHHVYRRVEGTPDSAPASPQRQTNNPLAANARQWDDDHATPGVTYEYSVSAVTVTGSAGSDWEPVTFPPYPPTNPQIANRSGNTVTLTWDASRSSDHIDGYRINKLDQGDAAPDWVHLADVSSSTLTYTDRKVPVGHGIAYSITAFSRDRHSIGQIITSSD